MMGDKPPVRQSGAQVLVDEHITQGAFAGKAKLGAEPSRLLDTLMQPGAMPGAMNSLRWQSALGEKPALNPMTRLQTALAAQVDGDGMLLQSEEGEEASQAQSGYSSRGMEGAASRGGSGHSVLAQSTLSLPVKHPQWGEQLAQRVLFLAQNNQQLAQIRLNPAHLGPIQIKMKLDQDQAVQVSLHAHHALTRDAIEQAVPRLKEMFAQQGLTLGDIQVQADAQGHAQAFAQMRREASAFGMQAGHTSESEDENSMVPVTQVRQDGLIDHFV